MGAIRRRLRQFFTAVAAAGCVLMPGAVSSDMLKSRPLTPNERAAAYEVFGNTIRYNEVRVYRGAPRLQHLITLDDGHQDAITPNGNIYITDPKMQQEDLAAGDMQARRLFIHEMTHVWQYQNGRNVRLDAAHAYVSNSFNYGAAYNYNVDDRRPFTSYNIEQQAHMVEDYYSLRGNAKEHARFAKLEAKLRGWLPLPGPQHPSVPVPPPAPPRS